MNRRGFLAAIPLIAGMARYAKAAFPAPDQGVKSLFAFNEIDGGALVTRTSKDGTVTATFEALHFTPPQHIDLFIRPALKGADLPEWAADLLDRNELVDIVYDHDTAISALKKLSATVGYTYVDFPMVSYHWDFGG